MIKVKYTDDEKEIIHADSETTAKLGSLYVPHVMPTNEKEIRENQEAARRAFGIPKRINKYIPHQGNRERMRRLAKIYQSHPHDCPCKSCELMDAILKSKGIME